MIHFVHGKVTGTRIDPPKKTGHQSMKNTLSIRNCSTDHPKYAAALITGLFFFYFSAFAIVRVFTKLIFSYARNGPCLSVQMSTAIESTYFVSLTAGRLVALFVTMVLHMKYILMVSDKTTVPSKSFGCLEFGPEVFVVFSRNIYSNYNISWSTNCKITCFQRVSISWKNACQNASIKSSINERVIPTPHQRYPNFTKNLKFKMKIAS